MFVRTDDLASALRLITAGSCVSIVGPDGSGRSMLLREIAGHLEQRGYPTIRILGIESLRGRPFDALDLAGETPTGSSPLQARQLVAALAERAAGTRAVLLVDDAPFVDEESWGSSRPCTPARAPRSSRHRRRPETEPRRDCMRS